jgi:hypothetical protein
MVSSTIPTSIPATSRAERQRGQNHPHNRPFEKPFSNVFSAGLAQKDDLCRSPGLGELDRYANQYGHSNPDISDQELLLC